MSGPAPLRTVPAPPRDARYAGLALGPRALAGHVAGGRPIQLYVVGQAFNLVLTLIAAWLAFGGVLFEPVS